METNIELLIENLQSTDDELVRKAVNVILQANITDRKLLPSLEKLLNIHCYTETDDNGSGGMPYVIFVAHNFAPQAIAQILANTDWQMADLQHYLNLVDYNFALPTSVGNICVLLGEKTIPLLQETLLHPNPKVRSIGLNGLREFRAKGICEFAKNAFEFDSELRSLAFYTLTRFTLPVSNDAPTEFSETITWSEIIEFVKSVRSKMGQFEYRHYLKISKNGLLFQNSPTQGRDFGVYY